MNRRITALLGGAALAAFALVGCGGDDDDTTTPATNTPRGSSSPSASSPAGGTTTASPTAAANGSSLAAKVKAINIPADLVNGRKIGKDDAKVKLQVYEDFRCSHCLEFTANFEQHLVDTYVKPGLLQIEFRYFPLAQASLPMMAAAQCAADQGQFWPYSKQLFIAQAQANEGGPPLSESFGTEKLKAYAAELKLDSAKFEACYTNDATLDPIAADYRDGQTIGVKGTPAFVVNGKLQANNPSTNAAWKTLIESAAR